MGTPGNTLLLDRSRQAALVSGENGGFSAETIPFSRETVIAMGSDCRLYRG